MGRVSRLPALLNGKTTSHPPLYFDFQKPCGKGTQPLPPPSTLYLLDEDSSVDRCRSLWSIDSTCFLVNICVSEEAEPGNRPAPTHHRRPAKDLVCLALS